MTEFCPFVCQNYIIAFFSFSWESHCSFSLWPRRPLYGDPVAPKVAIFFACYNSQKLSHGGVAIPRWYAMITVDLSSNVQQVFDRLREDLKQQIPFAASLAINEMAFETREAIKNKMDEVYEGGAVAYTKNAIYSTRSNKRNLRAMVYVGGNNPHRIRYVLNTFRGGEIPKAKKSVFQPNKEVVPLTAIGNNMRRGYVRRMLGKPGSFIYHKNPRKPGGRSGDMPSGLYARKGTGKSAKVRLLVAFDDKQVNEATFNVYAFSRSFVSKHFNSILLKSVRRAIMSRK